MAYNQNQFNKEYSERLKQSRQIGQAASSKPYTIEQYIESTSVKKQQKTPRWTSDDLYDLTEPDQQRTMMEEMLRNVGLKIQPIDLDIQETYMEAEKKRALERLLTEAGILSEFKTVYIPKE